jgi:serine/threonine-protein kinase SRPK3
MAELPPSWTSSHIEKWLQRHPPAMYDPERSMHGMKRAFISQEFEPLGAQELASGSFKLADFGSGELI